LRFLDRTRWHTTLGRTPLDEGSARGRDLYLTTHNTHKTDIYVPGGIRSRNAHKRSADHSRHRRFGYWNRPSANLSVIILAWTGLGPNRTSAVTGEWLVVSE
jgi:hypothetical protein